MNLTDVQLLGRFWATDIGALAKIDETVNDSVYTPETKKGFVSPEHRLASLVEDDIFAEQHIDRAKLFAATHPTTSELKDVEERRVTENCSRMNVDLGKATDEIRKLALKMNETLPTADRFDEQSLTKNIDLALRKIFASKQIAEYIASINPPRDISPVEMLELKNGALGLVKLLQSGRLDAESILHYLDTETYDLRNAADLVKIAKETRTNLQKTFVDADGVSNLIKTVDDRLSQLESKGCLKPGQREALMGRLEALKQQGEKIVSARTKATKILETDLSGMSPEKALKTIKNAFRGFRYDLDCARGKAMTGRGESFRRFWDNVSIWSRPKVSANDYKQMVNLEHAFNDMLVDLDVQIGKTLVANGTFAKAPETDGELGSLMREGVVSVAKRAEDVTSLTHETNDMIRAHFQGSDSFSKKMHTLLDPIVKNGGMKRMLLSIGADFGFKVGSTSAKVGGAYDHVVRLDVPKGGGRVSITYENQGGLEASVGTQLGSNALKADGNVKGGSGETQVFDTLDDAIASLKGSSMLADEVHGDSATGFLSGIAKPFRMLGSGVVRFLRWTGALAQKVETDNTVFRAHLKESGILNDVDNLLCFGKNTRAKETRNYKYVTGGVNAKLQLAPVDVQGGYTGRREFATTRKVNISYVQNLVEDTDEARMQAIIDEEPFLDGSSAQDATLIGLRKDFLTATTAEERRNIISKLGKCLDALERGGAVKDKGVARALAHRFRYCAALFACVEEQLPENERAATRKIFTARLANPAVEFPEDVFNELLVTTRDAHESPHEVHVIDVGVQLKPGESSLDESAPIFSTMNNMFNGPGSKIMGRLTIDRPVKTDDARPWKNQKTVKLETRIGFNTPVEALLKFVSKQVAAQFSREPNDVLGELTSSLMEAGFPSLLGVGGELVKKGVGELFKENEAFRNFLYNAGLRAMKVADKVIQFAEENLPLETIANVLGVFEGGSEYDMGLELAFNFKDGKFQSFACSDEIRSMSTFGVRVIGIGVHMKTGGEQSTVRESVFPNVSLDTAMEHFALCGSRQRFHTFVMKNAKGMLALASRYAEEGEVDREMEALNWLDKMPSDKAKLLRARFSEAKTHLLEVLRDEQASDFRKLNVLESYVGAMVAIFTNASIQQENA